MSETNSAGKPNGKHVREKANPLEVAGILRAWAEHDRQKAQERQKAAGEKPTPEKDLPIQ